MTMRLLRCGALLLGLLAALPSPTLAEPSLEFDLRVGPAIALNDASDLKGTGAALSGAIMVGSSGGARYGVEIGGNLGHDNDTTIFQVGPVVRLQAKLSGRGFAYLIFGAGYYEMVAKNSTLPSGEDDESNLGLNAGVGVLIPVSTHASLGVDVRYHRLVGSGEDPSYLVPGFLVTFTP